MSDEFHQYLFGELPGPPPIPPKEFLLHPESDCKDIISHVNNCSSLSKGAWSSYTDPCLPAKLTTAAITTAEITTDSYTTFTEDFISTVVYTNPPIVTGVISDTTTTRIVVNISKSPQSVLNAGIPAWLIGVIVVAILAFIVIITLIVICIIKTKKGESQERRTDFVLTDFHRVNYLHNKMEKGEKFKQRKKSGNDDTDQNASNNNAENGHHILSLPPMSSVHDSFLIQGASPPGYGELSKCYTRLSVDLEPSCISEHESNRPSSADRIYTPTILDGEPESRRSSSADRQTGCFTPAIIEETEFRKREKYDKKSPYAVSNVLPNIPVSPDDDLPPPAPHGMYANHQFEKLQGFRNHSFVCDDEHRNKPLPPNPFPDLRSHTSLYAESLFDNVGETGIYKKKKKPIPKKRQKKKAVL